MSYETSSECSTPTTMIKHVDEETDIDAIEKDYYVWISRSQPRDPLTGAISFDITYDVGKKNESWSRVSIIQLMDMKDNTIHFIEVVNAINDWIEIAKMYPHKRRNCICCNFRANKGRVLCRKCNLTYGKVIYA